MRLELFTSLGEICRAAHRHTTIRRIRPFSDCPPLFMHGAGAGLSPADALLSACALTGLVYVSAQYLARRRLEADDEIAAKFTHRAPEPIEPPPTQSRPVSVHRSDEVVSVHVYWPDNIPACTSSALYGWHFPGGAGDYVVVVAGFGSQTEPRPLRGMAHAAPLGTCAPSQEEVVMRRSASFDIHVNSETVQLAWYVV